MKNLAPNVGEEAPDFKVQTAAEEQFHLHSALEAGQNILLTFYRGHW